MMMSKQIRNLDWDKLKSFYYVAKSGSINNTAQALHITQPSISRHISLLEGELGHKVFFRSSKGVMLTEEGEILFRAICKVFADLEQAQTLINDLGKKPQGQLRIASTVGFAELYLANYLEGFITAYPDIDLSLYATDVTPDLSMREAEAIIHPKLPESAELIQIPLISFPLKLYASPGYLKEYGVPKTVEELSNHRLIAFGGYYTHPFNFMDWHLTAGMPLGQMREPYIQANLAPIRCKLAQANLGIICLPTYHPGLKEMNLVEVLPDVQGPTLDQYFIFSRQFKDSKRINIFINYITECFKRDYNLTH
jgi:DNA-binding transcriptional LysR family regulator